MEQNRKSENMITERKYTIALDIDETLLHSYFPASVTPAQMTYLRNLARMDSQLPFQHRRFHEVILTTDETIVTELRPFVREFLIELGEKYYIGIYSAAGPIYAQTMKCLLFDKPALLDAEFSSSRFDVQLPLEQQPLFILDNEACEPHPINPAAFVHKPLRVIVKRCPWLKVENLILIDNIQHNGYQYPDQFVLVPDFQPMHHSNVVSIDDIKDRKFLLTNSLNTDNFLQFECLDRIANTIQKWEQKQTAKENKQMSQEQKQTAQEKNEFDQESQEFGSAKHIRNLLQRWEVQDSARVAPIKTPHASMKVPHTAALQQIYEMDEEYINEDEEYLNEITLEKGNNLS